VGFVEADAALVASTGRTAAINAPASTGVMRLNQERVALWAGWTTASSNEETCFMLSTFVL
jgi:hypothetical protein